MPLSPEFLFFFFSIMVWPNLDSVAVLLVCAYASNAPGSNFSSGLPSEPDCWARRLMK